MKRTPIRVYAAVYVPVLALLAATMVAAIRGGRNFAFYLRDPSAIGRIHPMAGVVSQVGALLWAAAAVAAFLTAGILKSRGTRRTASFLTASGWLTTILCLDDLFQGHEYFVPQFLGLPERSLYLLYVVAVPLYLVVFRREILRQEAVLMGLALAFFALSVAIDVPNLTARGTGLIEDAAKFLGIASWCAFFLRTSHHELLRLPENAMPSVP